MGYDGDHFEFMPFMDITDRNLDIRKKIAYLDKKLKYLEIQEAKMGIHTPAYIKLDIGDTRSQLSALIEKREKYGITMEEPKGDSRNIPHNLPGKAQFFIQRGGQLENIVQHLSDLHDTNWIIGICGVPGRGKTTLALQVAHHCLDKRLFDAIIWVTAEREVLTTRGVIEKTHCLKSYEDMYNEIAQTLDIRDIMKIESVERKRAEIRKILKRLRCLLVIDNLETIGGWRVVEDLRDFVQPTKIIVTCREKIETIDMPISLENMKLDKAMEFMRELCRRQKIRATDRELEELFESTFGNPLAMHWCISLMNRLPVPRVLKKMKSVDGPLLSYCFSNSRRELTKLEYRILSAISLFHGNAGYEALLSTSRESEDDFDKGVEQLITLSLINFTDCQKYNLLPLTRSFILEEMKRMDAGELLSMRRAYAKYFLSYTKSHDSRSGEDLEAIGGEHDNIYEIFKWLEGSPGEECCEMLPELAMALREYQWLNGYWNRLVSCHSLAFRICEELKNPLQMGKHAYEVGFTRFQQGNIEQAETWGNLAKEAMEEAADPYELARVKRLTAMVARKKGDAGRSERILEEMIEAGKDLLGKTGDPSEKRRIEDHILADACTTYANLEFELKKNYEKAEKLYREALGINEKYDQFEKIGLNLNHLGEMFLSRYETEKDASSRESMLSLAGEHFENGLSFSQKSQRSDQIMLAMWGRARVAEERGKYDQALRSGEEALQLFGRSGAAETVLIRELIDRVRKRMGNAGNPEPVE